MSDEGVAVILQTLSLPALVLTLLLCVIVAAVVFPVTRAWLAARVGLLTATAKKGGAKKNSGSTAHGSAAACPGALPEQFMLKLPAAVPIEEAEWGPGGKDAGQNGETDLDPRCSAIDAWYQRQESVAADPGNAKKTAPRGRGLKIPRCGALLGDKIDDEHDDTLVEVGTFAWVEGKETPFTLVVACSQQGGIGPSHWLTVLQLAKDEKSLENRWGWRSAEAPWLQLPARPWQVKACPTQGGKLLFATAGDAVRVHALGEKTGWECHRIDLDVEEMQADEFFKFEQPILAVEWVKDKHGIYGRHLFGAHVNGRCFMCSSKSEKDVWEKVGNYHDYSERNVAMEYPLSALYAMCTVPVPYDEHDERGADDKKVDGVCTCFVGGDLARTVMYEGKECSGALFTRRLVPCGANGPVVCLNLFPQAVRHLVYSASSGRLAVGCQDEVYVVDLDPQHMTLSAAWKPHTLSSRTGEIMELSWHEDGLHLCSAGRDGKVCIKRFPKSGEEDEDNCVREMDLTDIYNIAPQHGPHAASFGTRELSKDYVGFTYKDTFALHHA